MNNDLLEIEVRLLVLKYSYPKILSALAKAKDSSPDELERLLKNLEVRAKRPKKEAKSSFFDVAEEVIKGHQNYPQLRVLALDFNNKKFLPELKDVKRFLERSKIQAKNVKSRGAATKAVFEVLRGYRQEELKELLSQPEKGEESPFSVLAKEIIEGSGDKRR